MTNVLITSGGRDVELSHTSGAEMYFFSRGLRDVGVNANVIDKSFITLSMLAHTDHIVIFVAGKMDLRLQKLVELSDVNLVIVTQDPHWETFCLLSRPYIWLHPFKALEYDATPSELLALTAGKLSLSPWEKSVYFPFGNMSLVREDYREFILSGNDMSVDDRSEVVYVGSDKQETRGQELLDIAKAFNGLDWYGNISDKDDVIHARGKIRPQDVVPTIRQYPLIALPSDEIMEGLETSYLRESEMLFANRDAVRFFFTDDEPEILPRAQDAETLQKRIDLQLRSKGMPHFDELSRKLGFIDGNVSLETLLETSKIFRALDLGKGNFPQSVTFGISEGKITADVKFDTHFIMHDLNFYSQCQAYYVFDSEDKSAPVMQLVSAQIDADRSDVVAIEKLSDLATVMHRVDANHKSKTFELGYLLQSYLQNQP